MKQNRSSAYDISRFARPPGAYFDLTNTISAGGRAYKCLFGTRREDWPPGILAITEEGVILWIHDEGGKVTTSPEENGIDW
jgi:hypothetical protein